MKLEIVSHCYSEKSPCYAVFLNFQLSSLLLFPTKHKIQATVFCTRTDTATHQVLRFFDRRMNLKVRYSTIEELGRRSIGRNAAAKKSDADALWFTDVDYLFRESCLNTLMEFKWPKKTVMIFPEGLRFHKRHELGDNLVRDYDGKVGIFDVEEDDFVRQRNKMALGGIQIVRGDFARKHGYLNGFKKYQKAVEEPFVCFRDDVHFRRFCVKRGVIEKIYIPGVFRLRHSYISCPRRPGHVPLQMQD